MTTIFEHFDKVIEIELVVPNAYKKFKNYETLRTLENRDSTSCTTSCQTA